MKRKLKEIVNGIVLCTMLVTQCLSNVVLAQESLEPNFHVVVEGEGIVQIKDGENLYTADAERPLTMYLEPETNLVICVDSTNVVEQFVINEETIKWDGQDSYSYTTKESNSIYVKFVEEIIKTENEDNSLGELKVTYYAAHPNSTYTRNNCIWQLSNGAYAYCGEAANASPLKGLTGPYYVLTPDMVQNYDMTRKILYYGYKGPACILNDLSKSGGLCVTNEILQKAVSGMGVSELVGDAALKSKTIDTWWPILEELPGPPSSYQTYMVDYSVNGIGTHTVDKKPAPYQRIFYGVGTKSENGFFQLTKSSSNTELVEGNDCYSLEGCEYGIYSDEQCQNLVDSILVDEQGNSEILTMNPGTYYVKEIKAGKGYNLDTQVYEIKIQLDEVTSFDAKDTPKYVNVGHFIQKVDADTKNGFGQGDARLQGAQFEVKFYAGEYEEGINPYSLGKTPSKTWLLETDKDGVICLEEEFKVGGDDFYTDAQGNTILPLGTITLRERKAPNGYQCEDKLIVQKITEQQDKTELESFHIENTVFKGEFEINKVITDGQQSEIAQAEYGAKFDVVLKSYYEECGKDIKKAIEMAKEYGSEFEYEEMVTNKDGIAKSNLLAYGEYVIEQIALGENGAGTEMLEKPFYFTVSSNEEKPIVYGTTYEGKKILGNENEMVRFYINDIPFQAYVSIVKKDQDSEKTVTLNSAIFKIKMVDEKGNPIKNYDKPKCKTDEEGYISVKVGLLSYDEFATNSENRISILDTIFAQTYIPGASEEKGKVTIPVPLPEGNYVLEEVKAPNGYLKGHTLPFSIEQTNVSKEGEIKTLEVIYSNKTPKGKIVLEKSFDGSVQGSGKVTFEVRANTDIVDPSDNTLLYKKGDLIKEAQLFSDGTQKQSSGIYELDTNNQVVITNLPLGISKSSFTMKELSTYSDYQVSNDVLNYSFEIKDDSKQEYVSKNTLLNKKISIQTSAHKKDSESKIINGFNSVEFVDTVSYVGLESNKNYILKATLMDVDSNSPFKDETGKAIEVEYPFTPKNSKGSVDVPFSILSEFVSGKKIVVFEKLYNNKNEEIASHEDIHDKNQTLEVQEVSIRTLAQTQNGTHEIQEGGKQTFTDTVYLSDLNKGSTYKLYGVLMDKKTKKEFMDMHGNTVKAEKQFVYNGQEKEVLSFEIDATDMAGASTVVFETLNEVHKGYEECIAVHEDFDDEDQEINFVKIRTLASSDQNNHNQLIKKEFTIKDTVSYTGLTIGKEYTLKAILMDRLKNEPILDNNGNTIEAQKVFIPESRNGKTEVIFHFNDVQVAKADAVIFERLYRNDIEIASHTDIQDENQSIMLIPLQIKINKIDGKTKNPIVNKDFEFSMYSDKACTKRIAKGTTDTTFGFVFFENIPEGFSYIKETKAPRGYKLSNQVVVLERKGEKLFVDGKEMELLGGYLVEISYSNNTDTTHTSVFTNVNMYWMTGLSACVFILFFKKKMKDF